jgi:hypothetical protein
VSLREFDATAFTGMRYNKSMKSQRPHSPYCPRLALTAVLASALLLCACQDAGPEAAFEKYLGRLARTLNVSASSPVPATPAKLPRPGQLQIELPPDKLDALDFLALSGCAVQITIGRRNSSLGRMAAPSQRLLLELEYLQLAPACIEYQRETGNDALAEVLQQAWLAKRLQLPARIFNATLGSIEYRDFWRAGPPSPDYPAQTSSAVISALGAINTHSKRWLSGDYNADNQAFEILLSEGAKGDGGALWQALLQQQAWLDTANTLLDESARRGPLCAPGRRADAADILPNIVRKYFIGAIQPRAAALGRRYHQLLPAIAALEELLEAALPANYSDWKQQREQSLAEQTQAPRRHVLQLQAVLESCSKS